VPDIVPTLLPLLADVGALLHVAGLLHEDPGAAGAVAHGVHVVVHVTFFFAFFL